MIRVGFGFNKRKVIILPDKPKKIKRHAQLGVPVKSVPVKRSPHGDGEVKRCSRCKIVSTSTQLNNGLCPDCDKQLRGLRDRFQNKSF